MAELPKPIPIHPLVGANIENVTVPSVQFVFAVSWKFFENEYELVAEIHPCGTFTPPTMPLYYFIPP
jgi:hypothetical protein